MRLKPLYEEKAEELYAMPKDKLVERIMSYDDENAMESYAYAHTIAFFAKEDGYKIPEEFYKPMVEDFAAATCPKVELTDTELYKDAPGYDVPTASLLDKRNLDASTSKTEFVLHPLFQANKPDPAHIVVFGMSEDGRKHVIGFLDDQFIHDYKLMDDVTVPAIIHDHSNGQFTDVSYEVHVDIEPIVRAQMEQDAKKESPLALTEGDLDFAKELNAADMLQP